MTLRFGQKIDKRLSLWIVTFAYETDFAKLLQGFVGGFPIDVKSSLFHRLIRSFNCRILFREKKQNPQIRFVSQSGEHLTEVFDIALSDIKSDCYTTLRNLLPKVRHIHQNQ